MPATIYIVDLTTEEREALLQLIRRGKPSARKVNRARILLQADEGQKDEEIEKALHTSRATVGRVRKRFVQEGLERALNERQRVGRKRKLSGREEAHFVALACSEAPEGHKRWTLRLLADKMVELELTEAMSHETVRQLLKKTSLSLGKNESGASPR